MRIGVITYDFYPYKGGQGRYLIELYNRIYKKEDFLVFSPNVNNLKNHITLFKVTQLFGKNLLYSLLLNFKIDDLIRKYGLDIVHLNCGPGGILLNKKPKARLICTVYHTYYQQQKYISGQKWKYLLYSLEKRMYGNADKLIAVSEDTRNVLIQNYGVDSSKIELIHCGVDLKRFKRDEKIQKFENSLLFVGRLDKRKGIDFLIKALPLVKKEIPNVKLFVIGSKKMPKNLENFIRKNGMEQDIELLGFVQESLSEWYNHCQITTVPSVFEGLGIVALESMACGTPVVASDVDGLRSIIENNKNGILVEYNNKEELANQIVRLLKTPLLRKKFSKNGLKTVKEKFDMDRIALKTVKMYENVVY